MSKIQIGVIGAGRWGPNLIRNFDSHRDSAVIAVADSLPARQKAIKDRYPNLTVTGDAQEVLNNPNVTAVVICTPTASHYELTKTALENGKHVFVEKPLATTGAHCAELVRLAEKQKKTLFVGHVFVYNAGIQAAARYIRGGELGKILYVHATRTNLGPIRTDVSALWDLAPHDISILQYWLGELPDSVSALGGKFLNPRGVEDVNFATYRFPSGVMANLHVSWLNPKKVREIVVVGEKKMLVWDDMDINHPIRIYDKAVIVDRGDDKIVDSFVGFRASIHEGDTLIPKLQLNEPLAAECNAFLEAVRNPASSLSNGAHGAAVVSALEATDVSMREQGRAVEIRYELKP